MASYPICRKCRGPIEPPVSANQVISVLHRIERVHAPGTPPREREDRAFKAVGSAEYLLTSLLLDQLRLHEACVDDLVGVITGAQVLESFRAGLHLDHPEAIQ